MIKKHKCSHCKEWLPATSEFFYKARDSVCGLQHQCIECQREYEHKHRMGITTSRANRINHILDSLTITRAVSDYRRLEFDIMRTEERLDENPTRH